MIYYDRKGCPMTMENWSAIFQDGNYRRVVETRTGNGYVSTVWLGLDYSFGRGDRPIIFETMVFGGTLDGEQKRYCTEEEALVGHKEMVAMCSGSPTTRIVEI